ncbi:hypothetical protein SNE40_015431 [Patella caerulea]|uniref:Uncharacterized protein n=1 Tax=Patella caerulea TaxID=87958 RepID=A0AAN8JL44_PATCE
MHLIKRQNMKFGPDEQREYRLFRDNRRNNICAFLRRPVSEQERQEARRKITAPIATGKENTNIRDTVKKEKAQGKRKILVGITDNPTSPGLRAIKIKRNIQESTYIFTSSSALQPPATQEPQPSAPQPSSPLSLEAETISLAPSSTSFSSLSVSRAQSPGHPTVFYTPTNRTELKLVNIKEQQSPVVLIVGGFQFTTSKFTLKADPNSLLAELIKEDSPVKPGTRAISWLFSTT